MHNEYSTAHQQVVIRRFFFSPSSPPLSPHASHGFEQILEIFCNEFDSREIRRRLGIFYTWDGFFAPLFGHARIIILTG